MNVPQRRISENPENFLHASAFFLPDSSRTLSAAVKDKYNKDGTWNWNVSHKKTFWNGSIPHEKRRNIFFSLFWRKAIQNHFSYIILPCFTRKNKTFLYHFFRKVFCFSSKNIILYNFSQRIFSDFYCISLKINAFFTLLQTHISTNNPLENSRFSWKFDKKTAYFSNFSGFPEYLTASPKNIVYVKIFRADLSGHFSKNWYNIMLLYMKISHSRSKMLLPVSLISSLWGYRSAGECLTGSQEVTGSNPVISIYNKTYRKRLHSCSLFA